ncbi:MAG: DEAD/DEAH box helicase, partial [Halobacillus sp.]
MMQQAEEILQKYYGYSSFRKGQKEAISHVLHDRNTLAVMPTGGGKSLCY